MIVKYYNYTHSLSRLNPSLALSGKVVGSADIELLRKTKLYIIYGEFSGSVAEVRKWDYYNNIIYWIP